MKTKELKEWREKSQEQIRKEVVSTKQRLADLRFQAKSGQVKSPREIRHLRTTVAQLETIAREKQRT